MLRAAAATAVTCLVLTVTTAASSQPARPSKDPAQSQAGEYVVDKRHASVIAKIDHLGFSNYAMRFNGIDASYTYDPARPEASKVAATVDPTSVDTGLPAFNTEIASPKILNAGKFPTISFVSKSIKRTGGDRGTMTGDLTFFGTTKPITFDVVFNGGGVGMGGVPRMGFSATGAFKRSDFGFNFLQGGLGDRVELQIEAEFTKKPS